jgi:hypothetical protein
MRFDDACYHYNIFVMGIIAAEVGLRSKSLISNKFYRSVTNVA